MRFDAKQLKEMSDAVKAFALTAVRSAGSGHVGIVLDAADIITSIYANFLRRGQDKFVLSAGHGSALLYSVLKLAGYDILDLNSFRKIGGLPGHPEFGIDGIFATTGPLGQGVGNAVGLALAAKIKKSDEIVYCLCSDGDLMEGVAQEAIAFAGRYKLDNLVLLWDDNGISIDGAALTDINMSERMQAAGWSVLKIPGNDFNKIDKALNYASINDCMPTFIQCKTVIGKDSSLAGSSAAHGYSLSDEEMGQLISQFDSLSGQKLWASVAKDAPAKYILNRADVCPKTVKAPIVNKDISTRELSGMFLESLVASGVNLVGGSADLSGSTSAKTKAHIVISPRKFEGNFVNYGVREHAMGAVMNGMAVAGLRPYGSTFLVFSDYMRPAIRLAALSKLPVIYLFTHDSIAVGADGPTHQPVEQLASLRLMPGLNVFRPCNAQEIKFAWCRAIAETERPTAIILSRQKIKQINTPDDVDLSCGGYIIKPAEKRRVRATIIATGSEVPLAVAVAEKLGNDVQVVSMPSVELFRMQDEAYKKSVLKGYVIAIEASASAPWFEFADAVVGIDSFGVSGSGEDVYKYFGFDIDTIVRDISKKLK